MAVDLTRLYIKQYIQQLIKNANIVGDNVKLNAPVNYSFTGPNQTEVRIQSLDSTSEVKDHSPRRYRRDYILSIELAYAPDTSDYDASEAVFETLLARIEEVVETDEFLQDEAIRTAAGVEDFRVEDTFLEGITYRTEPDASRPIYVCILRYKVCYNHCTGAVVETLKDLQTLTTETTPGRGSEDTPSVDSEISF